MDDRVENTIRKFLVDELFVEIDAQQIGLDDGLQSVIGLDSLGFAELRVLCERHFHVHISDEDFTPENFSTIRRLANLIRIHQQY